MFTNWNGMETDGKEIWKSILDFQAHLFSLLLLTVSSRLISSRTQCRLRVANGPQARFCSHLLYKLPGCHCGLPGCEVISGPLFDCQTLRISLISLEQITLAFPVGGDAQPGPSCRSGRFLLGLSSHQVDCLPPQAATALEAWEWANLSLLSAFRPRIVGKLFKHLFRIIETQLKSNGLSWSARFRTVSDKYIKKYLFTERGARSRQSTNNDAGKREKQKALAKGKEYIQNTNESSLSQENKRTKSQQIQTKNLPKPKWQLTKKRRAENTGAKQRRGVYKA